METTVGNHKTAKPFSEAIATMALRSSLDLVRVVMALNTKALEKLGISGREILGGNL
jgi:hypothetical protein